jgi:hypothetical protein
MTYWAVMKSPSAKKLHRATSLTTLERLREEHYLSSVEWTESAAVCKLLSALLVVF